MQSKYLKVAFVLMSILLLLWFGLNFAPRSYIDTPKYEFNISEKQLIDKIKILKSKEPSLKVPSEYKMVDGRKNINDHWYHIYVYYKKENEVINCWVRGKSMTSATLGFVSIKDKLGKWRLLDKDFDKTQIVEQRKIFEKRFINKLKDM